MAKQARKLLNKGDLTAQEVANALKVQLKILRRHPNAARSPSFSIPKLLAALTAQAWNKFLRYVAKPTARFDGVPHDPPSIKTATRIKRPPP